MEVKSSNHNNPYRFMFSRGDTSYVYKFTSFEPRETDPDVFEFPGACKESILF